MNGRLLSGPCSQFPWETRHSLSVSRGSAFQPLPARLVVLRVGWKHRDRVAEGSLLLNDLVL
eukprot:4197361-Amphidinium_carterae.1